MNQETKKNQNQQMNNTKTQTPDKKKKLDLALKKVEQKYDKTLKNLAK